MRSICVAMLVVGLLSPVAVRRASGDDALFSGADHAFLQQAPAILQFARDKGYRNVGVLKFRIAKGDGPVSDSVGTLNSYLADRLQVALLLANPLKVEQQVGIIDNASAVAAGLAGANHLTAEGRQQLLAAEYPLAWGTERVTPDAFLTGEVQVSADLREMRIQILAFGRTSESLEPAIPAFTAPTAASQLPELGESFTLRGTFDVGTAANPAAARAPSPGRAVRIIETAARVRTAGSPHPLQDPQAPVALEILYNGVRAPVSFREGQAFLPEPQESDVVTFVLRRNPSAVGNLGVVLKVNGENTLYRQRRRDVDCNKWILEPNTPPITVAGYQVDGGAAEKFRVLSRQESTASEMNYGVDVGMITLTVFAERGRAEQAGTVKAAVQPALLPDEQTEDLLALTRGLMPPERPKNLAALKYQLRQGGRSGTETRGLIQQGERIDRKVRQVVFDPDPTPVMSAAVIYYRPAAAKSSPR